MMEVRVLTGSLSVSAHSGSLTLGKGKSMEYHPSADAEVAKSHARVVRLSYVSGTVMVKRPGSAEEEKAMVNTPIQEGFELSTSGGSYAEVEFENGSTARVGELSKLLFHQLALDANGNKLNGMTFEQGYATFHFLPEHNSSSSANKPGKDGTIHFQPAYNDVYHVKIADATVTADGKCEFRTDLDQDRFRVEVFNGAVDVVTPTQSSKLGEGKILERKSAARSWLSTPRKELSRTLGISGRRHGISRCCSRKKTRPSIRWDRATAGVILTLMANGSRFPAADLAGRLTRGQVGRPTPTVSGDGTREWARRGFPANPGAG